MVESEAYIKLMNPWVLHMKKMELELKCPSCLNLLSNPVLLPCDHIFCRSCIPNSSELGLDCGLCRSPYGHSDIRKAPHMENLVNIYKGMNAVIAHDQFQSPRTAIRGGVKNEESNQKINLTPATQPSPASPPSFGENKDSNDDDSDNIGKHSGKHFLGEHVVEGIKDDTSTKTCDIPGPRGEQDLKREKKRQKLEFEGGEGSANSRLYSRSAYRDLENNKSKSEIEHKVEKPLSISKRFGASECLHANTAVVCEFCKSSQVSEASGPMMHYANGKPIVADDLSEHKVRHVHRKCVEWAPQAYFVDSTVMNLDEELARGARLKCSSCGLKGAALGCWAKSCKKSYHVPCAVNILDCRWDIEKFTMLCPAHPSMKFPRSTSKKRANLQSYNASEALPSTANEGVACIPAASQQLCCVGEASPGTSSEWVLCGSALSSEDKHLLAQFVGITRATISNVWQPNVTHVIAATNEEGACSRTLKVLMAILNGRWILKLDWIRASIEANRPVMEEPYEVCLDIYGCRDGPKNGRLRIMDKAPKLFSGLDFYFSGDFVPSYKGELEQLVLAAGGRVLSVLTEDIVNSQGSDAIAASTRVIVYEVNTPFELEPEEVSSIVSQRHKEARALGYKTAAWVVDNTWILESIAACKLQSFT